VVAVDPLPKVWSAVWTFVIRPLVVFANGTWTDLNHGTNVFFGQDRGGSANGAEVVFVGTNNSMLTKGIYNTYLGKRYIVMTHEVDLTEGDDPELDASNSALKLWGLSNTTSDVDQEWFFFHGCSWTTGRVNPNGNPDCVTDMRLAQLAVEDRSAVPDHELLQNPSATFASDFSGARWTVGNVATDAVEGERTYGTRIFLPATSGTLTMWAGYDTTAVAPVLLEEHIDKLHADIDKLVSSSRALLLLLNDDDDDDKSIDTASRRNAIERAIRKKQRLLENLEYQLQFHADTAVMTNNKNRNINLLSDAGNCKPLHWLAYETGTTDIALSGSCATPVYSSASNGAICHCNHSDDAVDLGIHKVGTYIINTQNELLLGLNYDETGMANEGANVILFGAVSSTAEPATAPPTTSAPTGPGDAECNFRGTLTGSTCDCDSVFGQSFDPATNCSACASGWIPETSVSQSQVLACSFACDATGGVSGSFSTANSSLWCTCGAAFKGLHCEKCLDATKSGNACNEALLGCHDPTQRTEDANRVQSCVCGDQSFTTGTLCKDCVSTRYTGQSGGVVDTQLCTRIFRDCGNGNASYDITTNKVTCTCEEGYSLDANLACNDFAVVPECNNQGRLIGGVCDCRAGWKETGVADGCKTFETAYPHGDFGVYNERAKTVDCPRGYDNLTACATLIRGWRRYDEGTDCEVGVNAADNHHCDLDCSLSGTPDHPGCKIVRINGVGAFLARDEYPSQGSQTFFAGLNGGSLALLFILLSRGTLFETPDQSGKRRAASGGRAEAGCREDSPPRRSSSPRWYRKKEGV